MGCPGSASGTKSGNPSPCRREVQSLSLSKKPNGGIHLILDLNPLTNICMSPNGYMEAAGFGIAYIRSVEFLASVDIQDAYLHISICPIPQCFLHFAVVDQHIQFISLCGLSCAPRVFTKMLTLLLTLLRSQDIHVTRYPVDLLKYS